MPACLGSGGVIAEYHMSKLWRSPLSLIQLRIVRVVDFVPCSIQRMQCPLSAGETSRSRLDVVRRPNVRVRQAVRGEFACFEVG